MEITRIRGATGEDVEKELVPELARGGFQLSNKRVGKTHFAFKIDLDTAMVGHNLSPYYTHRKGSFLGWNDWVWVNGKVNDVLDRMGVSANVQTLNGQFVIRRGTQRFDERDWEDNAYRNVGSIIKPIMAIDAWTPAEDRVSPDDAYYRGARKEVHVRRSQRRVD
jgi:hypothetical protein